LPRQNTFQGQAETHTGGREPSTGQRHWRWLLGHQNELKDALGWFTEPPQEGSPDGPWVPLDDLFRPEHHDRNTARPPRLTWATCGLFEGRRARYLWATCETSQASQL